MLCSQQSAISSMCVELSISLDLSITNVYMDVNVETYNTVHMQKSFVFADDKIKNLKDTDDKVITIFCYLPVDKTRNLYKSAI